ncbi:hypothetical protein NA57DRAFT_58031 [Rhizodiscina lignyota]|uniref:Prokaryotic-type class I peptide chain release factors domain-containing protein n=1 Tax=Rhizodiscina lignyota TaxID=1504668 RepID=A0A9P4IE85_9PEZI|nr:hypothetical protein NA57DRAFT_58031 [Rhizodiscina lignyota]
MNWRRTNQIFFSSRWLTQTHRPAAKPLPPRIQVQDEDIEENFLKGTGPGGQKINKTNSAVQLKHLPSGLVVKCQETRSRSQNRKIARRILGERLEEIEKGDQSRTALKRQAAAKKKASKAKKSRRKYRKLDEEKKVRLEGDSGDQEEVHTEIESDKPERTESDASTTPSTG